MKKRKRHSAEQIVKKLRDADAMLASGKSVGEVLQSLEISEAWDFVQSSTVCGRKIRFLNIVDEHTRLCLSIKSGRSITSEDAIDTLAELFSMHGVPAAVRIRTAAFIICPWESSRLGARLSGRLAEPRYSLIFSYSVEGRRR